MCAPIPLGMRRNSLHENPHSRVFSARRPLAIKSRQTTIPLPIPQNIPLNQAPQLESSLASTVTGLPVTTLPITVLSPGISVSNPGLSVNPEVHTLSITSSAILSSVTAISTLRVSSTYDTVTSITPVTTITPESSTTPEATITSETTTTPETTITSETTTTPETTITSETTTTPETTITSETTTTPETTITSETTTTPESTTTPETTITAVSQSSNSTAATTSYNTSIVSSSTTNVVENTVISSPNSVTPANLSAHNPSFYVGIVLGTVAAIACLCALIAWFFRFRRHVRCRHAASSLKLPWAKPVDGSWGLESSRHCPDSNANIAAISAMHLGSREDLADVQAWSPRGDRDVGEPRRAESGNNGSTYSLQNHHIPEYCLFSDDSVRSFVSSEGYSTTSLLPHHNLRQLPSHLIDQELAARVSREHASLRSNDNVDQVDFPSGTNRDCGTPRETMNKPRFLSLRGNGLSVPWHPNPSGTRSMVERLRNHHGKLAEPPWEQISPRQNLDEIDKDKDVEADSEPWSNSFKSSLVSAFNAVAANLSSAVGTPQMNGNVLASAPSKRTAHKSVRDTIWDENVLKANELSRETSVSTITSKAWTLEETREGAGVVHLFIPSVQVCGDEPVIQRPHLSGPILSFGDGDDFISDCEDHGRRVVEHPQVPLIASEKPPPAVIRPDRFHAGRNNTKNANDSSDSIVIEPSPISRLSSFVSSTTGTSTIPDGTTGVVEALKDRRNRALEV